MRRLPSGRSNASRSASAMATFLALRVSRFAMRVDPLSRSVDVMLELPDRNALLELLDDVPACLVRFAAVRMRDRDRDARFAELEDADAMLDRDVAAPKALARL